MVVGIAPSTFASAHNFAENPRRDRCLQAPSAQLEDRQDACQSLSGEAVTQPARPQLEAAPLLLAAPENLNPGLYEPPVAPPVESPAETPKEPDEAISADTPDAAPWLDITALTVDFKDDTSSFDQDNRLLEPVIYGRLRNGDQVRFGTGLNQFRQPNITPVTNIPLRLGWQRQMGEVALDVEANLELFDRLPAAAGFEVNASVPLGDRAQLSFNTAYGPYKFNATTLENQITAWRYGPQLFWQIDRQTSFFSSVQWGRYSDGNREQQSFSRLERRWGDFSIAANLFNWRYQEDVEAVSGYFSPVDFLVFNGEIAWQKEMFDFLRCRLAGTLGQQRSQGTWTNAYSYQSSCTVLLSETLELDINYLFNNVRSQSSAGSDSSNQVISSQLRVRF